MCTNPLKPHRNPLPLRHSWQPLGNGPKLKPVSSDQVFDIAREITEKPRCQGVRQLRAKIPTKLLLSLVFPLLPHIERERFIQIFSLYLAGGRLRLRQLQPQKDSKNDGAPQHPHRHGPHLQHAGSGDVRSSGVCLLATGPGRAVDGRYRSAPSQHRLGRIHHRAGRLVAAGASAPRRSVWALGADALTEVDRQRHHAGDGIRFLHRSTALARAPQPPASLECPSHD